MEKICIFVVSDQDKFNLVGCGNFVSTYEGRCNLGLPILVISAPQGLKLSWSTGDRYALFLYQHNDFSNMTKTLKNCKGVHTSVATCSPTTAGIQSFLFEGARQVRVTMIDGDPWFTATDVCAALSLPKPAMAVRPLDDDEKRKHACKFNLHTSEINLPTWFVSESGLFTLIFRCRDAVKPGTVAHRFRKWVTSEVLPSLRKTGSYRVNKASKDEVEAWKEKYQRLSEQYSALFEQFSCLHPYIADVGGNPYLMSLFKAFREMLIEETKGHCCIDLRFAKMYEAANTLFPEAKRALRGKNVR